jgi:tetratricopeptide (TPR) repeat protein
MTETLEEITALADRLYREREELEQVRRSLLILDCAPAVYEALWRRGRARFFLGQEAKDKREARGHYLAGIEASGLAVRALQERVEGHFWLGVNLALLAGLEKPLRAVPRALRAKRELKRAASIDSSYHAAGPLRVLARLESKLPRILGGGRERARLHFEAALRLAPSNTVTRLYFAELLIECGERARAQAELDSILKTPFDPDWAFEIKRDRKRALEISAH